jgi:hypothetical protein
MHDGWTHEEDVDAQDSERLFRALNRLLHAPSVDARMQAEDALRRHKALMPNPWDDSLRAPAGATVMHGELIGSIVRSTSVA